jgi:hypothetical protein
MRSWITDLIIMVLWSWLIILIIMIITITTRS